MRALTLHRHHAAAVMHCGSRLANRKRPPSRDLAADEVIAIHAGMAGGTPAEIEALRRHLAADGIDVTAEMLTAPGDGTVGSVVAVCRVGGYIRVWDDGEKRRHLPRSICRIRGGEVAAQVRRWWVGPYAWELIDVQVLAVPVLARGALGLWRMPDNAERAVRAQVAPIIACPPFNSTIAEGAAELAEALRIRSERDL